MPKTYNSLTVANAAAGSAILASDHAKAFENINNYRVPPMARITMTANVAVADGSHTNFAGFLSTNAVETIDTDDMVALSGTASAITVQTAGVYACTAVAVFASSVSGVRLARIVRSRGGTLVNVATASATPPGVENSLALSGVLDFAAGDLIRLMVFQNTGGPLNMGVNSAGAEFGVTHLAATWLGQVS